MSERIYITLEEASEYLRAKGLTGQSARVLRVAVSRGLLAALKDGGVWKTTIKKLDDYEDTLWREASRSSLDRRQYTEPMRGRSSRASSGTPSGTRTELDASARSALNLVEAIQTRLKNSSRNAGGVAPRAQPVKSAASKPKSPKPQRVSKRAREQKEVADFMALSKDEQKQRVRDYLDGKRVHWRF